MARLFHTTSHHCQEQEKGTRFWRGVFPVEKENVSEELSNTVCYLGFFFTLFLFLYPLTLLLLQLPFGFVSHCCFKLFLPFFHASNSPFQHAAAAGGRGRKREQCVV